MKAARTRGMQPHCGVSGHDATCYFYHPRRIGSRVVRDYYGCGPQTQLAADLIGEVRDRRAALLKALKEEQEHWESLGVEMDRLDRACEVMVEVTLKAEGLSEARRRRRGTAATVGADPRAR